MPKRSINFTGYNIIRKKRLENGHGGLAILVKQNLNYTEIQNQVEIEN